MVELTSSDFIGTLPQWGTFAGILTILAGLITVWIKGIPERLRVRIEADTSAAAEWRVIEARVTTKLDACEDGRMRDADTIAAVKDENFRLKIAMSLVLQELESLDPDSATVKKAQAIMVAATGPTRIVEQK